MKIAVGSDHRGFHMKQRILTLLPTLGHTVIDLGPENACAVDYPDYALKVAQAIHNGTADRGILICGTGLGMCIAANKVARVRAVPCHDLVTAEISRRHNDANIICLSADMLSDEQVDPMIRVWLETAFEGGRHARRVEKIDRYEQEQQLSAGG